MKQAQSCELKISMLCAKYRGMPWEECILRFEGIVWGRIVPQKLKMHDLKGIPMREEIKDR